MEKIYYIMIKGRTLESRDLKELLARAVSEKRSSDRKFRMNRAGAPSFVENASNACAIGCHAVAQG